PALGMTAIVPDMDASRPAQADPRKLVEAIEDWGATNMFGSPALIDRLGRHGEAAGVKLPSLRRVLSAGAPVQARVIERFSRMLAPGVEVFTPYGATESLPVASAGSKELLSPEIRSRTERGLGICVGKPVPGTRVRVIRITDAPIERWSDDLELPRGETGEIVVSGPVVTRAYFNRDEATRLAKIAVPGTDEVVHRMGDVGYLDEEGRLWFCGRKVHRVETAEGTLFTIPCEGVFNVHPHVKRTALVGLGGGAAGGKKRPALCVELDPEAGPIPLERLRSELAALGAQHAHTRAIATFLVHPAFPVDIRHNAKIFRDRLAAWAEGQAARA
ncbi:MAG TPA: AMP-binding protein, partial [Planctomycetota bacterium]|nr:AMP-binding protein [Planctomycetota bacterium]